MPPIPDLAAAPHAAFLVQIENYVDQAGSKIQHQGTLVIAGDVAVLAGKVPLSRWPFPLFGRTATKDIPLSEIVNVTQDGSRVCFDRLQGPLVWLGNVLCARNPQEAAAIVALLPTLTTPDFDPSRPRPVPFAATLSAVTPHAFVTPIIIALNVLVFLAMVVAGVDWFAPNGQDVLAWGADYWPFTTSGQWWRLLTAAFLHFGMLHLAFNMWALGSVGKLTERLFGNRFYLCIYLFGALTSSLASTWWDPFAISAGASGAIFAVYGALLAYLAFQRASLPKPYLQQLLKSTVIFVGYNVVYGFSHAGISNSAHLGGLAGGLLLGSIMCRPVDLARRAAQTAQRCAAGAVIACAVLAASLYLLPKAALNLPAEEAFRIQRNTFTDDAQKADAVVNNLFAESEHGKLSDADFAKRLDDQVIPAWQTMLTRLSTIALTDSSPSQPLHALLVRYCQTRCAAFRSLALALRTGNQNNMEDYKIRIQQANQMNDEITRAAGRMP